MRRLNRASFLAILFCLLIGCGVSVLKSSEPSEIFQYEVGTLSGVSIEIKEETISTTGVTVALINDTERTYSYGAEFELQKLLDGEWYNMTYITDNFGFPALESFLGPGKIEEEIDWTVPYGMMKSGTYRVVKKVYKADMSPYYLAAEFIIS